MKKLIYYITCMLVILLTGCSSDEVKIETPESGVSSNLRTAEEAVALAKNLYESRHNSRADVAVADVAVIGSSASRAGADTLIYAVNFADNQGFTLVSASYIGVPVLGYTDKGNYDDSRVSSNESFSFYLDAAADYVNSTITIPGGSIGGDLIKFPTKPDTSLLLIAPRIPVEYGQVYPEGQLYSNYMAGCVQTACAMVLAYAEQPATMTYTDPSISLSSETLNWSAIKKHVKSSNNIDFASLYNHNSSCNATTTEHEVLSRICKELGYRNNADPKFWGTSATLEAARTTLQNLLTGYVSQIKDLKAPYTDLIDNMRGTTSVCFVGGTSDDGVGHVWICDGGDGKIITTRAVLATGETEVREEKIYYQHFNWGQSGDDNGYFYVGVFDSNNSSQIEYHNNVRYFTVAKK